MISRTFGRSNRRMTVIWIPALVVMAIIYLLSAQSYEQQSIKGQLNWFVQQTFLQDYLSAIHIQYGSLTIDGQKDGPGGVLEFILRKMAHFLEYMLLSICLLRGIRSTTRLSLTIAGLLTAILAVAFAITDEIHQLFAVNRGSRWLDVFVDTWGVLTGIVMYSLLASWKRRRTMKKAFLREGSKDNAYEDSFPTESSKVEGL